MDNVWVLWWRYHDGSAAGVLRSYSDENRALNDIQLLADESSMKLYTLEKVPVFRSPTYP